VSAQKEKASMKVNVFIKKVDGIFIAHCLELDIVATGSSLEEVKKEIWELVMAQVSYAFSNDNLSYLYHSAPKEVWEEFYKCKRYIEEKNKIDTIDKSNNSFIPPWISACFCNSFVGEHA
jgi:predicted RNase H-like HicB family nuclease